MNKQTVLFFGSQGSGKGTQAGLLKKYIEESDPDHEVFLFDTGSALRDIMGEETYTANLMRDSMNRGELQPVFLPSHTWTNALINHYSGEEHLIMDGSPRTLLEAELLDTAFRFYGIDPTVLYLEVSEDIARERLLSRGRADDTESAINKRLSWYKKEVTPVAEYYRASDHTSIFEINAEQEIEKIQSDIIDSLEI